MPFYVGSGCFTATISDSRIRHIAHSDTPPEMRTWGKIKAFFCPTHKSEALECIRKICHPPAGTTREDMLNTFAHIKTLAYSGSGDNIQPNRHGENHFSILDENNREILSATLDDAGRYTVKCEEHEETHTLSLSTELGEEHAEGASGTLWTAHAPTTTALLTEKKYKAVWSAWKKAAPSGESHYRKKAVERMWDCLKTGNQKLELDSVLTSLPDLPPNITELKLRGQYIGSSQGLTSLPALPPGLQKLDVYAHPLISLPALPPGLQELRLTGCKLPHLPELLPPRLRVLKVSSNQLTHLPALPPGLQKLEADGNRLARLPELPLGLRELSVNRNQLAHLPELPLGLRKLQAAYNQLASLPELPSGLRELSVAYNRLTHLPISIAHLPYNAQVFLLGNVLAEPTLRTLHEISLADSSTPQVLQFRMTGPSGPREPQALHLAVGRWLTPVQEGEPAPADRWQSFEQENDTASFSSFLDRLSNTKNFNEDLGFIAQIASWLTQLAEDNELRAKTFAMATEATSSCEDRVTLALNQMKNVQLVHNAEKGEYDNHLSALVSVGREMFRLGELELIARDKVKNLNDADELYRIDEIEVYLGYQNKLKAALGLSSVTTEMQFFSYSNITESDLQAAEKQVKTAENSQFREWILHWEPLRRVLERTYPESWKALSEKKILDYDDSYRTLSDTELKPAGLVGNTDAERTIGARAMDSAEKAFLDALRPLANRMLGGELNARWP